MNENKLEKALCIIAIFLLVISPALIFIGAAYNVERPNGVPIKCPKDDTKVFLFCKP
jgi:hypothetical protein